MEQAHTNYQQLTTGELVVCLTCGAAVAFTAMTTHTHWHEVMEPAWPLLKASAKPSEEAPGPLESGPPTKL